MTLCEIHFNGRILTYYLRKVFFKYLSYLNILIIINHKVNLHAHMNIFIPVQSLRQEDIVYK